MLLFLSFCSAILVLRLILSGTADAGGVVLASRRFQKGNAAGRPVVTTRWHLFTKVRIIYITRNRVSGFFHGIIKLFRAIFSFFNRNYRIGLWKHVLQHYLKERHPHPVPTLTATRLPRCGSAPSQTMTLICSNIIFRNIRRVLATSR